MKTIGIIGGFGPEATAQFYEALILASRKRGLSHQPHIIVWNVPVPKKFEDDLLLRGAGQQRFKPLLVDAARQLEEIGVDAVVLPCNTLHVFAHDIAKSIKIPFGNIVNVTLEALRKQKIQRVGLLGTSVTVNENIFASEIQCIPPPASMQKLLNKGFHERVVHGSSRIIKNAVKQSLRFFKRAGINDVLLASTDLHGDCPDTLKIRIHDTLDILVDATVNML